REEYLRVQEKLTNKDPIDKTKPGCYHKVHLYKMVPGKTYVIEMHDQNGAFDMDPYLRLEDSAGVILAQDDDSGGGPRGHDARIVFAPTKEDTYRIIATTLGPGVPGSYLLTAQPVAQAAAPVYGKSMTFQMPVDIGDITVTPLPAWGMNPNL